MILPHILARPFGRCNQLAGREGLRKEREGEGGRKKKEGERKRKKEKEGERRGKKREGE